MIMTFCNSVQARLPIYVLLLSGNNCLLYSSIGISFKSIKQENEISHLIHVHNCLKQIDVLLKILEEIGGILLKNNVGSSGILFKKQKRNLIHPWTI